MLKIMVLTKRDLKKLILTNNAKNYGTDKDIWKVGIDQ